MKQTLSYHPSVITSTAVKSGIEAFDLSVEAFINGNYRKALQALLDSINPDICKRFGDIKGEEYRIPHGPLLIHIRQDDEKISITAPLVDLPEENTIAVLRQVAGANFCDLDLARIILHERQLSFEYSAPLVHSHPRKIYRVLQEICRAGEKYDREFTGHFKAERTIQPRFTPYDFGTVDYIYEVIQQSCRECTEAVRYFENFGRFGDMRQIIRTTFLKIMYVAHPQGELLHSIQKAIRDLDRDLPLAEIVATGKADIRELQKKTKEDISSGLYYVETFISGKDRSNLQNIRETYESCYKQITTYMEAGEYREAGIRMICKLYEMYYNNRVQEELNQAIVKILKQTAGQPWVKAAPVLYRLWENIMHGRLGKIVPPLAA